MQEKKDWLSGRHIRDTANLARQYHEHGFALQNSAEDVLAGRCSSLIEARGIWYDRGKHERYAIAAELIDRTICAAENHIHERPPFGLLKKIILSDTKELIIAPKYQVVGQFLRDIDLFDQAKGYFTYTIMHAQEEVIGQLKKASQNPTADNEKDRALYKRHLAWVHFANSNIQKLESLDPKTSLSNPIAHATEVMTDVLRVTPEVYTREVSGKVPSVSDLTSISVNSYPTVAYLASFELFSFAHAKHYLDGDRLDRKLSPDQFTLVEDAVGVRKLVFRNEIKHDLDKIRSDVNLMQGPRLTCPALINFGEGSAMQRLWWWHVLVGEALYQYLYPSQTPKS